MLPFTTTLLLIPLNLLVNSATLVAVLAGLGITLGFILALTDKKLSLEYNPLIDDVDPIDEVILNPLLAALTI